MSFAFRRVSSMRKLMWASLALNLFLGGALIGSMVSGISIFQSFMPQPPPPAGFRDRRDPPPIRMLKDVRDRLTPDGKVIFDAEFDALISEVKGRPKLFILKGMLQETLKDPNATDAEIRAAFDGVHRAIGDDLGEIFERMANVSVKLPPEDRANMALMGPGDMPPPPPRQ